MKRSPTDVMLDRIERLKEGSATLEAELQRVRAARDDAYKGLVGLAAVVQRLEADNARLGRTLKEVEGQRNALTERVGTLHEECTALRRGEAEPGAGSATE